MRYRRDRTPGATFFFTVVTEERRPLFNDPALVDVLRGAFRTVRASLPFTIDAIAVLPDHLHTIWTLPDADAAYDVRWNQVKGWFSKRCGLGTVEERAGRSASGSAATGNTVFGTSATSPTT